MRAPGLDSMPLHCHNNDSGQVVHSYMSTGAALPGNNEASAELITANGEMFT